MSRATFAVDACAIRSPENSVQDAPNAAIWPRYRASSRSVTGNAGRPARNAFSRSWSRKHVAGSDVPTARGSNPMTSNRASTSSSKSEPPSRCSVSTPGPPGPPKLVNRLPIRCSGSDAGSRVRPMVVVRP
ncbi:Uncharacterised protein [Mycobacteroides abscessus]|nr:Uncharacterised protein [Mycobacteroides abscessus]